MQFRRSTNVQHLFSALAVGLLAGPAQATAFSFGDSALLSKANTLGFGERQPAEFSLFANGSPVGAGDHSPQGQNDEKPLPRPLLVSQHSFEPAFGSLLGGDLRQILGAPARWGGRQWGLFAATVVGLGALSTTERADPGGEARDRSGFGPPLAKSFEPLGAEGSIAVLGGFYLAGRVFGSDRARNVAVDGAIASLIASGLVTPALKAVVGRRRPRQSAGAYDFQPFSGNASFPSGHTTQAFAVASVIATEYRSPWVRIAAYGTAALVGFSRVEHDAHYTTDVVAGALIGTLVGRSVAHYGERRRAAMGISPMFGDHGRRGLLLTFHFGGAP